MRNIDKAEVGKRAVYATLGARNYAQQDRQIDDFYATDPKVLELLLEQEKFSDNVWECACGQGHLSEVLVKHGYNVKSTDLVDRGYGQSGVDFLKCEDRFDGDIITNPPYKYALDFVKKAYDLVTDGHKVVMFLRIQFLEGKERREFFNNAPPCTVYVSSSRIQCAMNGDFETYNKSSALCYAWFIWEKGNKNPPIIKWFN